MRTFMFLSIVALCSAKSLLQNEFLHFLAEHDVMQQDPPQNTSDIIIQPQTPTPPPTLDDLSFTCPLKCVCQVRVVQCSDAGLKSVPQRIPKSTVMLDLQNNKITEIKETDFKNLPWLYALFLINNQITKIHPKAFRSIKHLKLLYLSWNLLPQIPANLPKSLVELRIDDNKIKKIQKEAFKGMTFLHVLEISGNPLDTTGIEPDAFDGVMRLIYIRISQAKLTSVPKNLPANLYELYLDHNKISSIELEDFRRYKDLYRLDLSYNQIKDIENGSLAYLPHLRQIHLENNKVRKVPAGIKDLKYLQAVYLHNNDISKIEVDDFCPKESSIKKILYSGISLFGNPVKHWEIQPASFRCVSGAYGVQFGNFRK
ncbi:asporin isoform X1 [Scyliorhinus canicula]|uniref:asporin isoform X1 n=2 Tax=Scyliorhinus canicula TaxID=7830 RepID=UPI0018F49CB2|nr:asporin isoform X1 [Scyliorhinus canicula]XP_038668526.1 asporin isoform X1 [Scyliorhinus canicula]